MEPEKERNKSVIFLTGLLQSLLLTGSDRYIVFGSSDKVFYY